MAHTFRESILKVCSFRGGFCDNPELAMENFGTRINGRKEIAAKLYEVVFSGGVNSEDLEKVVGKLTHLKTIKMRKKRSDEAMNDFKKKMSQHVGPPDDTVPKAIRESDNVRAYTKKDACRWIAEYEKLRAIGQTS